jgi:molybdopterin/thiamine biosynthesis adenylyltransferase
MCKITPPVKLALLSKSVATDLNRQLLMTHDALGSPRVESAERRLKDLNPRLNLRTHAENINDGNADRILEGVDIVVDCAPLFGERYAMNLAARRRGIPVVECAMYDTEAQVTTLVPNESLCFECLYPEPPKAWKREFPVFGAVSGTVACIGAMEVIKWLSGFGTLLINRMLYIDFREMSFRSLKLKPQGGCDDCGLSP